MAIDISQDLNITTAILSTQTETITHVYDTGSPAGTYLPGKDFSPDDNVSTGVVTSYQIGLSLSSKTNQVYSIDKLFLQSVDDPKTNGTGIIPFYYINTNPNPQDITDDNQYTLVPNYNANMISVVFDQTSGITSTSTVNLTLTVNYPNGLYWKTKIAPKIAAVAVKDGIQKVSDTFYPMEVRMSSTASLENDFYRQATEWGAIRLSTVGGVKGFYVPFYMKTSALPLPDINTLLDSPNPDTITYTADLNFTIDGTPIPIIQDNISLQVYDGTGFTVQSYTINGNQYTITLNRTGNITLPILLRSNIFLPYDPGSKTNVTMNMTGSWVSGGVVFDNWINEYIFSETTVGGINASQIIPLTFTNPPVLTTNVSTLLQPPNTNIGSSLTSTNLDFYSLAGSKFMLLYDSPISYLSDAAPFFRVQYTEPGNTISTFYTPPAGSYLQQYGYADLPPGYNANTISQNVFQGNVALGTYQDILDTGKTPNILITTVLTDILTGLNIDYTKSISFQYQKAQTPVISNTEFMQMYETNPTGNFTSYLYNSMLIGTDFDSVASANAQYGSFLASVDQFVSIGGIVYLDLGTVTKGQSGNIRRFNSFSTVRADLPVPNYYTQFQTSITDNSLKTITTINDYSQTYGLNFFVQPPIVNISTAKGGIFLSGSVLNFAVPANILPYLYLAGNPVIYKLDPNFQSPILLDTITTYSLTAGGIRVTMPSDVLFYNSGNEAVYLNIPVKFLVPAQDQVFNHENTTLDLSKLILYFPNQVVDGFAANTPYYAARMNYASSTLLGAGVDFTGLTVNKNFYPNGTSVEYIANVKNMSNSAESLYMALTVPTNEYNPLETSNNSQLAFINGITTFYPTTVLYYQTANQATPADIAAMKELNQPGMTLQEYYNTVVVNTWTLYHNGDALPNDVVMMVAASDNVQEGDIVRVDYSVEVQMDVNTTEIYINDAAFNYYSTASMLETQSNKVTIQNYNVNHQIPITKSPANQQIEGSIGTEAIFTITFTVPPEAVAYTDLTFTDQLPTSLALQTESTIQIGSNPAQPLNAVMSSGKLVTKMFTDLDALAGKDVTITLVTAVDQPENIPVNLTATNQAGLIINNDPSLVSLSNTVTVGFFFTNPFNIRKAPAAQNLPKLTNEPVSFQIYFDVPQDVSSITSMVITDVLPPALSYDPANSLLQIGDTFVAPLQATVTQNTVEVDFSQISEAAGMTVKITLGTLLSSPALLPADGVIQNNATITLNKIPAYSFESNTVTVTFGTVTPIAITKAPDLQKVIAQIGSPVRFQLQFTIPQNVAGYNTIRITDTLQNALVYTPGGSTIQYGNLPAEPLNATETGNTITVNLTNLVPYAGDTIIITLAAAVNNLNNIPADNQITNAAQLIVNNNASLTTSSNEVTVQFTPVVATTPRKESDTQTYLITQDRNINYTVTYFTPGIGLENTTITITDQVDPNLTINNYHLVGIASTPNITIEDNTSGNTIQFVITTNYPLGSTETFPTSFELVIAAEYSANTATDTSHVITNSSTIQVGTNQPLTSNVVSIYPVGPREQAITDLIESVALEETALSHILNAEGEKLQKILSVNNISFELMIETNHSVQKTVNSITLLESILQNKLSLFNDCSCDHDTNQ